MGLLDGVLPNFFSDDQDKAEAQRMGLLGFAGQMLASRGNFGQAVGRGLLGGVAGYNAGLEQQRAQLQANLLKQQVAAATRKNNLINGLLEQFSGSGDSTQPSAASQALDAGAKVGDVGPTVTNAARMSSIAAASQPGMVNGIPRHAIAADLAFGDGKNIGEWMFKRNTPDMQVSNGFAYDKNNLRPGFLPQFNVSQDGKAALTTIGPDGLPVVSAPRGALDTYKAYTGAGEQAKNENTLAPLDRIDPMTGRPYVATVQQLVDQASGRTPQGFVSLPPQTRAAIQEQANADKQPVGINFKLPNGGAVSGNVSPNGFNGFAGPGDLEQQKADIQGRQGTLNDLNKNWITSSFNPTSEAGQQAVSTKANITALRNIDLKTGSGTETRAAFANFLTGLGMAPENAKMYATNSQRFQAVAMSSLLDKFVAQKGPQTEGDAKRVQSTYAQLSNTPEANQFLADFAEAQADMAIRKAAFYQDAQPIARQEGDLTKVDREWKKIQGSIWDDPKMKRWLKQ